MAEPTRKLKLQGFSTKGLAGDLSAAVTKSIDSVTGGMGNAVLAGVNPVYGLYTVLAATPIGALFTSSVYMNIDSTGALAATAGGMLLLYPAEQRTCRAGRADLAGRRLHAGGGPAETGLPDALHFQRRAARLHHRHRRQHHPGPTRRSHRLFQRIFQQSRQSHRYLLPSRPDRLCRFFWWAWSASC